MSGGVQGRDRNRVGGGKSLCCKAGTQKDRATAEICGVGCGTRLVPNGVRRRSRLFQCERRCRVRAAFFAAWLRVVASLVRTAFFAACLREALPRLSAAVLACFESAPCDAAAWPWRFSAPFTALDRFAEVFFFAEDRPFFTSRAALVRVAAEVLPFLGGGSFTPARRAFDSPMAIACLVLAAPCLPSRM